MAYFGPAFYEFYGSTELSVNTILRPEDVLRKPGSCGRAAPGIELAILDDDGRPVPVGEPGELYVRRYAGVFDGYYKNPNATRETQRGDWLSVGDVAYVDADGFYYICDRKRDMIISGGVNIYPAEIEDALHRHPDIEDVAVFGVPDEEWGERVHAAVQPRPGARLTVGRGRALRPRAPGRLQGAPRGFLPPGVPAGRRGQAHQARAPGALLGRPRHAGLMASLAGRVALVTGGASGIGRAAALAFAREGARVAVSDVAAEGGDETVRLIKAAGGEACFVRADVSREADVTAMVDETVRRFGRLDCAFNNAGVPGEQARTADYGAETWARVLAVNLTGVWLCMKHEIPRMLAQGGGAIVNTASVAGLQGFARHVGLHGEQARGGGPHPHRRARVRARGHPHQRRVPRLYPHRDDGALPGEGAWPRGACEPHRANWANWKAG